MKLVLTPDWFLGSDVCIEVFSFFVLAAFFLISLRSYRITKNKGSLYLGVGFLLISLAELSTILTKFVLYYDTMFTQTIGQVIVRYQMVHSVDIFYYVGFFWHKILTLLGLYIIYRIPKERKISSDAWLAVYFIILSVVFSQFFFHLFHLTALILLAMITSNYIEIYKENKSKNTKILIIAFSLMALSQVIFIMSQLNLMYAVGQVIQLVSYIIMLVLIIRITKNGKKEKQNRHNI